MSNENICKQQTNTDRITENANSDTIIEIRKLKKEIQLLIKQNSASQSSQSSITDPKENSVSDCKSKYLEANKLIELNKNNNQIESNCHSDSIKVDIKPSNILRLKQQICLEIENKNNSSSMAQQNQLFKELGVDIQEMKENNQQLLNKLEIMEKSNADLVNEKRELFVFKQDLEKQLNEKDERIKLIINAKIRSDTKVEKLENIISLLKYQISSLGALPWTERNPQHNVSATVSATLTPITPTESENTSTQSNESNANQRYALRNRNVFDSKSHKKENFSKEKRKLNQTSLNCGKSMKTSLSDVTKTSDKSIEFN